MSKPSTKVIARRLRRYLGGMLAIGFGVTWWSFATPSTALASTVASFEDEPVVDARVARPMTRSKPVVATASRRPFEVVAAIASIVEAPMRVAVQPATRPVVAPPTRPFARPPVRADVVTPPVVAPPKPPPKVVIPPKPPVTPPTVVVPPVVEPPDDDPPPPRIRTRSS